MSIITSAKGPSYSFKIDELTVETRYYMIKSEVKEIKQEQNKNKKLLMIQIILMNGKDNFKIVTITHIEQFL